MAGNYAFSCTIIKTRSSVYFDPTANDCEHFHRIRRAANLKLLSMLHDWYSSAILLIWMSLDSVGFTQCTVIALQLTARRDTCWIREDIDEYTWTFTDYDFNRRTHQLFADWWLKATSWNYFQGKPRTAAVLLHLWNKPKSYRSRVPRVKATKCSFVTVLDIH